MFSCFVSTDLVSLLLVCPTRLHELPPSLISTRYPVTGDPPSSRGGRHSIISAWGDVLVTMIGPTGRNGASGIQIANVVYALFEYHGNRSVYMSYNRYN